MTNIELIKQLGKRLKRFSWLIIILALIFGGLFYFMAKQSVPFYTAKCTVFPLSSTNDNTISTASVSGLLGLADAPKSFSSDAAVNIIELALSRRIRDAVSNTKIPTFKNKTVAELLIEENNKHTSFMQNENLNINKLDSLSKINLSSSMLAGAFSAKLNKNGILELYFSNSDQKIVRTVSYIFIDKISEFYIELKRKKAKTDYEFAVRKADSLQNALNAIDARTIQLDESTFFTNEELKRVNLPKQNIAQEKQTVQNQYFYAINNREAAAYKLQKETAIIEALDKPEGPYVVAQKSKKLYAIFGFLLGTFIGIILVSWKIFGKYISVEISKALHKNTKSKEDPMAKVPA